MPVPHSGGVRERVAFKTDLHGENASLRPPFRFLLSAFCFPLSVLHALLPRPPPPTSLTLERKAAARQEDNAHGPCAGSTTRFAKKRKFLLLPHYGGRKRAPAASHPPAAKIREASRSAENHHASRNHR